MTSEDYRDGNEAAYREVANFCLDRLYVGELPNKRLRLRLNEATAVALEICKTLGFNVDEDDSLITMLNMLKREVFDVIVSSDWRKNYETRPSRKITDE